MAKYVIILNSMYDYKTLKLEILLEVLQKKRKVGS
jgi:hypothetical protein